MVYATVLSIVFVLYIAFYTTHGFYVARNWIRATKPINIIKSNDEMFNENEMDDIFNNDFNDDLYADDMPLYTVIWHKSQRCEDFLKEMELLGLNTVFIDDSYIVDYLVSELDNSFVPDEITSQNCISNYEVPLVYKDDELLETWFDIYSDIYPL
jgi:hypothetical protein